MNTETYQTFRNELITLLDRGTVLLPATENQGQKLRQLQAKLFEDQFTIALVAGFQCGKSTTFNTLCDGRVLSPLGFGAKTSGCLVFAQNLADSGEAERATVRWRTKAELLESFHCNELSDFGGKIAGLDLDQPEDCDRFQQAAEQEYERWKQDKASFDPDAIGLLDVIRCALLVARFYGDSGLVELRQRTECKPEDLSRFIRFPQKWEERWMKKGLNAFTLEESIFAFAGEIRFHIHSENLAKTGSIILDCPGLFASKWDSAMALKAIEDADAILYLLPGERAIGLSDLSTLKQIHAAGKGHKLFYALNMKKSVRDSIEIILPTSKATLEGAGINVADKEFFRVHADLALRAVQAQKLLDGKLDEFSKESTLCDYGRKDDKGSLQDSIEALLLRRMQGSHSVLDISDEKPDLTSAGVARANRQSQLPELIQAVEGFVIKHKAEFILIQNGADHVVNVLKRAESDLANREAAAEKNKNEQRAELVRAEERLTQFEEECSSFLERLTGEDAQTADYKLAEDFCNTLAEGFDKNVSNHAGYIINKEIVKPYFSTLFTWQKKIEENVRNILLGVLHEEIQNRFSGWFEKIKLGNNCEYNRRLRDRVLGIQKDINKTWENVRRGDNVKILERLNLVQLTGEFQKDLKIAVSEFESVADNTARSLTEIGGFGGLWLATVKLFNGIGSLLGMTDDDAKQVRKWVYDEISKDQFKLSLEECLKPKIQSNIKRIRSWYADELKKVFQAPGRAFQEHKSERERLFLEADAKLVQIASEAKSFRTGQIEPLRKEVEAFVSRCRNSLKGDNLENSTSQ